MRSRAAAYAALVAGGGLGLVASAQPWWRAVGEDVSVGFTGSEATAGLSQALVVVALSGSLLTLALKVRGRRVVGGVLALAGAAAVTVGALRFRPSDETVLSQVREATLADQFALTGTAWPWVYAVAGVLLLAGGVLITATAARWPARPDRFTRSEGRYVDVEAEPAEVWKAMDAGLDPTEDELQPGGGAGAEQAVAAAPAEHPDVRKAEVRDTMDNAG